MSEPPLHPEEKLRLALDLFETGVDLVRQRLRRERPELAPAAIERLVAAWVSTRPGAEHGDADGRPRKLQEPAA